MKRSCVHIILLCAMTLLMVGCRNNTKTDKPLFVTHGQERTGIDFSNNLTYSPQFNLFKYMYFYNGSGIGAGDFNNDGKVDLFFASNQSQNKLYLNQGGLKFMDVTKPAMIPHDGGWSTGVSVVDINNDGLLDMYVCRVGQYETLRSRNQFLINTGTDKEGIPRFVDKAKEYGLDFSGFSTQAAFFDYDNDGDLDMFLLNHSVHHNNNFRPRAAFNGTYDPLSGDRVFRNDESKFTDVTKQTGIYSTSISYGLGIAVSDINLDGFPDLYIGNDFHENDYLYINQKNGTFREESENCLMHTSQYSMGVDVADINNDAAPEIISMDMLPSDPYILKRSLGEDTYDLFHEKIGMGYFSQFTRNNLQYNRRNGMFSEIGLYSGIAATDWSWAPLWMDFDNDGLKDLFISNGIPKRMNDIDYVNFVTSGEVQQKITSNDMQGKDMSLINKFPEIKIPNKFYRNLGNLSFADKGDRVEGNSPTFSNGAVYADLDNDGDLDIVVNNIDNPVLVYENRMEDSARTTSVTLALTGPANNRNAIGAKAVLFSGDQIRTYEASPVKGFLSSMQVPLHIGIKNTTVDSLILVWPDRTFQRISISESSALQKVAYQEGLPLFDFSILQRDAEQAGFSVADVTASAGLDFIHKENRFIEFDREPLIPHMMSREGPAVAVADINKDGLDDVFMGSARDQKAAIYLQQTSGQFSKVAQPILDADSIYEDTGACWADVNRDGAIDLIVASGGNEFYGEDFHNSPRVYLNDGKGHLSKLANAFHNTYSTASTVVANDINNDGYPDLFLGGRVVPWAYGQMPQSYLLLNNGNGTFRDVTAAYSKELQTVGMVTSAQWVDLDKDGDQDLLLSLQWGGIVAFINHKGSFQKRLLTEKNGWWNFLLPVDVNGDGNLDLIAGNLGLNSRLKASAKEPVRLYFN
ncbi:MAG: VCBS repeat-containing protein, partial [Bacteroidota bacterium]|nr:VCBS repeat-containing protein [Bacteroidota bacterium]